MKPILVIQSRVPLPEKELNKVFNTMNEMGIAEDYHILVLQPDWGVTVLNPISETYEENTIIDSDN